MKPVDFLEEEDFEELIPLIKEFSTRTDVPFIQQINEVSSSFINSSIHVIVGKDEDIVVGYICGYFISHSDFYVSQIYSQSNSMTQEMIDFMESEMQLRGAKRIFGLTIPVATVLFERYGYKIERHLMSKILNKEEEK